MNTPCQVEGTVQPETDQPASTKDAHHYPIREFAHLTGVNPATLRAWERRYGIITPHRTAKGHRFYSDQQIESVRQILYWLEQGYPIRQVRMLLHEPSSAPLTDQSSEHPDATWSQQQDAMIRALVDTNHRGLDDLLNKGFSNYPLSMYHQFCLLPVLERLRAGQAPNLALRLFQQWLNRTLEAMLHQQQRHNQGLRMIVLATHPDDHTDSLIRACSLGAAGWRVDCLTSDIGPGDLPLLLQATETNVLWLHFHVALQHPKAAWRHYLSDTENTASQPQGPHCLTCLSGAVPTAGEKTETTTKTDQPSRTPFRYLMSSDTGAYSGSGSLHHHVQQVITMAREQNA